MTGSSSITLARVGKVHCLIGVVLDVAPTALFALLLKAAALAPAPLNRFNSILGGGSSGGADDPAPPLAWLLATVVAGVAGDGNPVLVTLRPDSHVDASLVASLRADEPRSLTPPGGVIQFVCLLRASWLDRVDLAGRMRLTGGTSSSESFE